MAALAAMLMAVPISAQERSNDFSAEIGADLVSNYVWRGQKYGGFSIQPTATIGWKGLSLEAWGSFALSPTNNGTDEEIDILLDYKTGGFHVSITDYFIINSGFPFFKYGGLGDSAHSFEANIGYDFGYISVNWYTIFAGNDGVNRSGNRAYSSYLQIDAPFKFLHLDWNATLGVVPYRTSYYEADCSDGFHINNIALQAGYTFSLPKKVTIPVFAQIVANPSSSDLCFFVGAGFRY